MRKFQIYLILLPLVAMCFSMRASAQEMMFKDGKRWVYRHQTSSKPLTENVYYFSYYASGDTVIDGKACKRAIQQTDDGKKTLVGFIREEDRRVYFKPDWGNACWRLIYDFGLKVGDRFQLNIFRPEMRVMSIDTIRTEHGPFARWHFCDAEDESMSREIYSYIEGIGNPDENILWPGEAYTPSDFSTLLSCYDGPALIMGWNRNYSEWTYSVVRNCSRHGRTLYGDVATWQGCIDDWSGTVQINGKDYDIYHTSYPGPEGTNFPSIRQKAGRVYMDREQFMKHVADILPNAATARMPYPETDEGEVVLYDFNLEKDAPYPDHEKSNGVHVAVKDTVQLRDMELRRRLVLSNGMELIEGLGCVNANGGYFLYLYDNGLFEENTFTTLARYTDFRGTLTSVYNPGWLINPSSDYYPQGTRWTELQLDTLLHHSWYTRTETEGGTRLIPNFHVVEYRVGDDCFDSTRDFPFQLKGIYARRDNGEESLVCYLALSDKAPFTNGMPVVRTTDAGTVSPTLVYDFGNDAWKTGESLSCKPAGEEGGDGVEYGRIASIGEKTFGGEEAVSCADMTSGLRILRGIGVTQWKGAACILGPLGLGEATAGTDQAETSHFKSILVRFERNGKMLYNVWPEDGGETSVQHPYENGATPDGGRWYDLQGRHVRENTQRGILIKDGRKVWRK